MAISSPIYKGGHHWTWEQPTSGPNYGPEVYKCAKCGMKQYDYVIGKWSGITDCPYSHNTGVKMDYDIRVKPTEGIGFNIAQFTTGTADTPYAKKENTMFVIGHVETLGGYRGILRSATTADILWQTEEVFPKESKNEKGEHVCGKTSAERTARERLVALESVIANTKLKA